MNGYTPEDVAAQLAAGLPTALAYTGAGVGAALVLFLAFLGIRRAFEFFRDLSNLHKDGGSGGVRKGDWDTWSDEDEARWRADMDRADSLK